jgi:hypothetical protein
LAKRVTNQRGHIAQMQRDRDQAAADYAKVLNAARGRTVGVSLVDWITHLEDRLADAPALQAAWQGCLDQANENARKAREIGDAHITDAQMWRTQCLREQDNCIAAVRANEALKAQAWPEEAARLSKLINEARDILAKV